MNYVQAEQRLKELLSTGFLVPVGFDYDTSLKVEELFHKLYESDKTAFEVEEVFEEGIFFEDVNVGHFSLSAGCWGYFGISGAGQTFICDEPFYPIIDKGELREIVEALTSEGVMEDKFEAVSGDQSLFDLVLAKDEHLYVVRNSRNQGVYATDYKLAKERILAERKLIEPEFVPYHTDTYLHVDRELEYADISAFRSRLGNLTCINVTFGSGNVEVVLDKGQTLKFAEELIAIANGVDCKE